MTLILENGARQNIQYPKDQIGMPKITGNITVRDTIRDTIPMSGMEESHITDPFRVVSMTDETVSKGANRFGGSPGMMNVSPRIRKDFLCEWDHAV